MSVSAIVAICFMCAFCFLEEIMVDLLLPPQVQAEARGKSGHVFLVYFLGGTGLSIDARTAEITLLLKAWGSGDEAALVRLTEQVYPELRRMALRYMKNEAQGNTLQATALVHEVYLRLVEVTKVEWQA